jgi:triosephosphate isomerase (TIM)
MFIGGNWKLNGDRATLNALANEIATATNDIKNVDIVLFPPFVYLDCIGQTLNKTHIALGAQNQANVEQGAFTGEVAPGMVKDIGCQYVLLGHSERRHVYHETNETITEKMALALAQGLKPVLCVGETKAERDAGQTEAVVLEQLKTALSVVDESALATLVIAYEPVWAIGTGEVATPEQAQATHAEIRHYLSSLNAEIAKKIPIIYGGSLKPGNAQEILAKPDVDGGLIGGASLKADQFSAICHAASQAG